jgi:hypothetical protein
MQKERALKISHLKDECSDERQCLFKLSALEAKIKHQLVTNGVLIFVLFHDRDALPCAGFPMDATAVISLLVLSKTGRLHVLAARSRCPIFAPSSLAQAIRGKIRWLRIDHYALRSLHRDARCKETKWPR